MAKILHKSWSRRGFVKTVSLAAAATQLPFWVSCVPGKHEDKQNTLQGILSILLPKDEFGPGALDWKADHFILWWMEDERMDQNEIAYVRKMLEEIQSKFDFENISKTEQEKLIENWAKESDYQSVLSKLLTLSFEAMVSHPLYGFSDDNTLNWLQHKPGVPQPSEDLIYPQILKTIDHA